MEPVRTCVGCRHREDKAELLRLVVVDRTVTVDRCQRMPGRGAYLHPVERCWELAIRKRALPRALRAERAGGQLQTVRVLDDLRRAVSDADPA